jgi:hypothetical protein
MLFLTGGARVPRTRKGSRRTLRHTGTYAHTGCMRSVYGIATQNNTLWHTASTLGVGVRFGIGVVIRHLHPSQPGICLE